jgi:hypothetical protein
MDLSVSLNSAQWLIIAKFCFHRNSGQQPGMPVESNSAFSIGEAEQWLESLAADCTRTRFATWTFIHGFFSE